MTAESLLPHKNSQLCLFGWVDGFKQGEPIRLTFDELSPGTGSDQAMLDSWIFITSKKKIFSMIQRLDAHADAVNCAEDTFFSAKYVF